MTDVFQDVKGLTDICLCNSFFENLFFKFIGATLESFMFSKAAAAADVEHV